MGSAVKPNLKRCPFRWQCPVSSRTTNLNWSVLKICIYCTYSPWAPHTYDFVVLTSLTHPRRILLVALKIGKAKDLSAPLRILIFLSRLWQDNLPYMDFLHSAYEKLKCTETHFMLIYPEKHTIKSNQHGCYAWTETGYTSCSFSLVCVSFDLYGAIVATPYREAVSHADWLGWQGLGVVYWGGVFWSARERAPHLSPRNREAGWRFSRVSRLLLGLGKWVRLRIRSVSLRQPEPTYHCDGNLWPHRILLKRFGTVVICTDISEEGKLQTM
jgi:hypothetical protein